MISLSEYITEAYIKNVNLPYTLDVYPPGGKNKDFAITWKILNGVLQNLRWKKDCSVIIRGWVDIDDYYNHLPIYMPISYWDRHNPGEDYNYNEYVSVWKQYLQGITKKYGKTKLVISWDPKAGRSGTGCLVINIDDPRYIKDLEKHNADEEEKKKATAEAERKQKELEKQGVYDGEHVGSRRNVGTPGEAVLTQWGWWTGD